MDRINYNMLNGVTLPKKRRIFKRRGLGRTALLPLVILCACLSATLLMGMILAENNNDTGLGHAGQNTGYIEPDREKL